LDLGNKIWPSVVDRHIEEWVLFHLSFPLDFVAFGLTRTVRIEVPHCPALTNEKNLEMGSTFQGKQAKNPIPNFVEATLVLRGLEWMGRLRRCSQVGWAEVS
jgi:hypothetical protein